MNGRIHRIDNVGMLMLIGLNPKATTAFNGAIAFVLRRISTLSNIPGQPLYPPLRLVKKLAKEVVRADHL